jgi:hypothetical protein
MALRDSMRDSAAPYLRPGEPVQVVIGAQTASQWLAALTGFFVFLGFNHYRIVAVTPARILVLDAGKTSMKKARGVVMELPRTTGSAREPGCGTESRPATRRSACTAGSSPTSRPPTPPPGLSRSSNHRRWRPPACRWNWTWIIRPRCVPMRNTSPVC